MKTAKLSTERTAAIEQGDEAFRLLVEQAPDAIIVLDLDINCIVEPTPVPKSCSDTRGMNG